MVIEFQRKIECCFIQIVLNYNVDVDRSISSLGFYSSYYMYFLTIKIEKCLNLELYNKLSRLF